MPHGFAKADISPILQGEGHPNAVASTLFLKEGP